VPQYEDVTKLTGDILRRDGIAVDVITGGFPCQDISCAGKQAGIKEGTRSGLWSEIVRLIGELRPRFVIVENVAALLSGPSEQRGGWFGRILGDLAECGYDAEWENIPAAAMGAPHRRERIWIVAYPRAHTGPDSQADAERANPNSAGPHRAQININGSPEQGHEQVGVAGSMGEVLAYATGKQGRRCVIGGVAANTGTGSKGGYLAHANSHHAQGQQPGGTDQEDRQGSITGPPGSLLAGIGREWRVEPDVVRVANGVSKRVDRLKGLGNAVIPQIPELIGRAILAAEAGK